MDHGNTGSTGGVPGSVTNCKRAVGCGISPDVLRESFAAVYNTLITAQTVRAASDAVMLKSERLANQSAEALARRADYGQGYFDKYAAQKGTGNKVGYTNSRLAQGIIVGKAGLAFRNLPELAVEALNHIRRVYDFTNLGRIFIEDAQNFPIILPAFHAGGVPPSLCRHNAIYKARNLYSNP